MSSNKPQIIRDVILIGILVALVVIAFVICYIFKKEGELAIVSYENEILFEVNMESGTHKAFTEEFVKNEMPLIIGEDLFVKDEVFDELKEGKGFLFFEDKANNKNYYFVKGNLGYVKIYYNKTTKKMKVEEETSPYNTCSKQGESNDVPIVCLPNFITIKFTTNELDDII